MRSSVDASFCLFPASVAATPKTSSMAMLRSSMRALRSCMSSSWLTSSVDQSSSLLIRSSRTRMETPSPPSPSEGSISPWNATPSTATPPLSYSPTMPLISQPLFPWNTLHRLTLCLHWLVTTIIICLLSHTLWDDYQCQQYLFIHSDARKSQLKL